MALVCREMDTAQVFERTLSRFWNEIEPQFTLRLSLKVKWGSISAQKLESEGLKSFPVSISLQTKAIRS